MSKVAERIENYWRGTYKLKNKAFVIYGMSKRAIYLYKDLSKQGSNVIAFTDSKQTEVTDRKFCGKTIWTLKDLKDNVTEVNVLIATYNIRYIREICKTLLELGVQGENIFIVGSLSDDKRKESEKILLQNEEKVRKVYENLADEESRIIYREILEYRVKEELNLTKDAFSRSVACGGQYFDREIVMLSDEEVYVDGGAYIGDTIDSFVKCSNGKFSHIYAFEADSSIRDTLSEMCSVLKISDRVDIMPYAMLDEKKEVYFDSDGNHSTSGKIENSKGTLIQAVSLDSVLSDKKVTFIKMDIEGAELPALKGAKHIIETQRPKLAICIYHSVEELYEIPLYLMETCCDYKFYVRHYSFYNGESVLYAIPNELAKL